ncbi:MAG: methyltransferase domain-containing protein [Candidatus Helarchaeota archaeon]|nr:methyltransferase domain-containing protein [Candidatus Helarchaeota archaeon]
MSVKLKGVEHLFHLIEDFLEVWTINTGLKLGIFDFLKEHPASSTHLAENLNYRIELIQTWCDTMRACGYLEKKDNKYSLTRWSKNFLWRKSTTYLGFIIQSIDTLYPPFISHDDRFRRVKTFPSYSSQHMLDIVKTIAPIAKYVVPQLFSEAPFLKDDLNVLDVGCGLGSYLIAMAEQNPRIQGLGVDKERIIVQRAEELVKSKGLQECIKFIQADILNFNLSEKFNCILMSNVLQAFNIHTNIQLLSRLSSNLTEDGYLIILECLIDESRATPKYGVLFNMYLRMESLNAQTSTLSEIKTMLERSSFCFRSHKPIVPGLDLVIAQLAK